MTEEFALRYTPQRVKERGFQNYRMVFQELQLAPGEHIDLAAYNEIWFLVKAEENISIYSDLGRYDEDNPLLSEQVHEHGDAITIHNTSGQHRNVTFIQILLLA